MGNEVVINQVIILFLTMVIGFVAKKRNIINDETINEVIRDTLENTLPAMIIFPIIRNSQMIY